MAGTGVKATFLTQLDDTSSVDKEGLGNVRHENGRWYKWVKFNDGAGNVAIVKNDVVSYRGDDGYEDFVVTGDVSDGRVGAGVAQSAPSDGDYFWIQIKGPATVNDLTAGGDGNALTLSGAADKELDVSAAVTDSVVAFAVDASAHKIVCDFPW